LDEFQGVTSHGRALSDPYIGDILGTPLNIVNDNSEYEINSIYTNFGKRIHRNANDGLVSADINCRNDLNSKILYQTFVEKLSNGTEFAVVSRSDTLPKQFIIFGKGGPRGNSPLSEMEIVYRLADFGFSVMVVNTHGSDGRGIDFLRSVFGNGGEPAVNDMKLAFAYARDSLNFPEKNINFVGYSFGGFLLMKEMVRNKNFSGRGAFIAPALDFRFNSEKDFLDTLNNEGIIDVDMEIINNCRSLKSKGIDIYYAERDRIINYKSIGKLSSACVSENFRFHKIRDSGHQISYENYEKILADIRSWIE
jgi:predicted esterase